MPSAVEATGRSSQASAATNSWEVFPIHVRIWPISSCNLSCVSLAKQLMAWSLVKRRPWIQLLWQSAIDVLPSSLGQYFAKEAKIEPWIRKDFAKRTRLAIRQSDVDEHFGLWLPTRRSYIAGVLIMANNLAKFTAPRPGASKRLATLFSIRP